TRDKMMNNETTNRFITGVKLDARLHQGDKTSIRLIANGGVDFYNLKTNAVFPRSLQFMENTVGGASIQGNTNNINTNLYGYLVNTFTPNSSLTFVTTVGATLETGNFDNILVSATQLIGTQTNVDQAGAANP